MSEPRTPKQLFGLVLMTVGGLIAVLSGLCTLGFAGVGLVQMLPGPADGSYAPVIVIGAFVVGIVPFLVGVGLYFAGKALRRRTPDA